MMGWQWHQLDHMQISCTSLRTDNHTSTSPLSFYRPDALPAAQQQRQRNEGKDRPQMLVSKISFVDSCSRVRSIIAHVSE